MRRRCAHDPDLTVDAIHLEHVKPLPRVTVRNRFINSVRYAAFVLRASDASSWSDKNILDSKRPFHFTSDSIHKQNAPK